MEIQSISRWIEPPRTFQVLWQSLIAWTGIALLAYIGLVLRVNPMTISSIYLLIVVAMASFCGFWQASLTSLMAVVCLDFLFLPPIFHLDITDAQDWVALGTFESHGTCNQQAFCERNTQRTRGYFPPNGDGKAV